MSVWTYGNYWSVVMGVGRTASGIAHEHDLVGCDDPTIDKWIEQAECTAWVEGRVGGDRPAEWWTHHDQALRELVDAANCDCDDCTRKALYLVQYDGYVPPRGTVQERLVVIARRAGITPSELLTLSAREFAELVTEREAHATAAATHEERFR